MARLRKQAKIVGVTQARMGSSRLPGKVLLTLEGQEILAWHAFAIQKSQLLSHYVIATSTLPADDDIAAWCYDNSIDCFRGAEGDVLERYLQVAEATQADILVRFTADCPLVDPELIDMVIQAFLDASGSVDHATLEINAFFRGTDVEVFSRSALQKLAVMKLDPSEREHVTLGICRRPDIFKLLRVSLPGLEIKKEATRLCIDVAEDFDVVSAIIRYLHSQGEKLHWRNVMAALRTRPDLLEQNLSVRQKLT